MKIAVTYEDGMVFQHFGHTHSSLNCMRWKNGAVQNEQVVDTQGVVMGRLRAF